MGHHYVPRFLLREWAVNDDKQRVLRGHYYDRYARSVRVKSKGENFFCNRPDLFTIRGLGGNPVPIGLATIFRRAVADVGQSLRN